MEGNTQLHLGVPLISVFLTSFPQVLVHQKDSRTERMSSRVQVFSMLQRGAWYHGLQCFFLCTRHREKSRQGAKRPTKRRSILTNVPCEAGDEGSKSFSKAEDEGGKRKTTTWHESYRAWMRYRLS